MTGLMPLAADEHRSQPTGRPDPWSRPTARRSPPHTAFRLLAGIHPARGHLRYQEHLHIHGARPGLAGRPAAQALIDAARRVGLRGRGGAGYPLAAKLAAVAGRRSALVVVNGAESEPASRKDAVLLASTPHLVLDGAALAAEVVGADEVVVWLHHGRSSAAPVERAIAERSAGDRGLFRVRYGPARYVAGESSAVLSHLSGGPATPTLTPPHATERGASGRPTLLSNAETLAQLALLARHGPGWFRTAGTPDEPGTVLLTLSGAVGQPMVVEVPFGTPVRDVLEVAGLPWPPIGVLAGGYGGSWLPWAAAAGLPVTVRDFRAAGASLGVGLLAVLPAGRCGLAETAHLVDWLAGETAGQCGPCVNGLPSIADAFRELAEGRGGPATVARLYRWSAMVAGRGLCHHPDGVAQLVRSALRTFDPEVRAHLVRAPCRGHGLPSLLPVPPTTGPVGAGRR